MQTTAARTARRKYASLLECEGVGPYRVLRDHSADRGQLRTGGANTLQTAHLVRWIEEAKDAE